MLVGVAFLPPSFPPSGTQAFYIIKRQYCLNICNTVYIYYLCTIFKSKVSLGMILLFTWHEVERFSRFFINWLNLPYLPYYYVTRLEHKASISLNSTQFSPKKSRQLLRRLFYDINTVCKIELHVLFYFSIKVQIL